MKKKRLRIRFRKSKHFKLGIYISRDTGGCGSCTAIFWDDLIISFDFIIYSLQIKWACKNEHLT